MCVTHQYVLPAPNGCDVFTVAYGPEAESSPRTAWGSSAAAMHSASGANHDARRLKTMAATENRALPEEGDALDTCASEQCRQSSCTG